MQVFGGRSIDLAGLQRVSGETFRWKGEYGFDLNSRETIYTHLNVFEDFRPHIPETFRTSPVVFLANIHPALQLEVLEQVEAPEFVALDTMNYWIEGTAGGASRRTETRARHRDQRRGSAPPERRVEPGQSRARHPPDGAVSRRDQAWRARGSDDPR